MLEGKWLYFNILLPIYMWDWMWYFTHYTFVIPKNRLFQSIYCNLNQQCWFLFVKIFKQAFKNAETKCVSALQIFYTPLISPNLICNLMKREMMILSFLWSSMYIDFYVGYQSLFLVDHPLWIFIRIWKDNKATLFKIFL